MSIRRQEIILFPSPTQLFIACNTEKRGEPGIFPRVSMMQLENFLSKQAASCILFCHGNFGPPKILVRGTKIPGKLVAGPLFSEN